MRVNITYSVELEEVLQVVKKITAETTEKLDALSKEFPKIATAVEVEDEKRAATLIDACRELTAIIDHRLFDCKSILGGYQQTLLQLQEENKENERAIPNEALKGG
jgi:hypothetical protein